MKRLFLIVITLLGLLVQANDKVNCSQGDQTPPQELDPERMLVGDASSSLNYSYDPNEVIGPEGYGELRWVSVNDLLNYTILFENDPQFATAAAQRVDVRFNFADKAWMKNFGIGTYCFANMSFNVNPPSNAYQQRIDLVEDKGYFVDVIGGLDVARKQGFWTFTTIDPETGYAPWNSEVGLLPINDDTHVGEGFVTFSLRPYEGVKTGDEIAIEAAIVFDENDTIPTNRWVNRIDAGAPQSVLTATPHPTLPGVYVLKFTGHDDENGSGLNRFLLYQANHSGIYEEVGAYEVGEEPEFTAEAGKQYRLFSIAVDNTGNTESIKEEPDVVLNLNAPPTDIVLSNNIFSDDTEQGGFIGRLTAVDSDDEQNFTFELAEGDGAIHNDLFQVVGDQLQLKASLQCADQSEYQVRVSATDDGGLSCSKAFRLMMDHVLEHPEPQAVEVTICEGDVFKFRGQEYAQAGTFTYRKSNDYMCDSVFVITIDLQPRLAAPLVTVDGTATLVSSYADGNQWFREDGTPVDGADGQRFTPTESGVYYVCATNGTCQSPASKSYRVVLDDNLNLTWDLSTGWNWVSSSFATPALQDAKAFLSPIVADVEYFTNGNLSLTGDQGNLSGNLLTIDPRGGYQLQVSTDVENTWSGLACRPEETPVVLGSGWNNIGYLPVEEHPLADALINLSPSEGDLVKSFNEFALYEGGKWYGTLEYMRPGEGFKYLSSGNNSFVYPVTRVFELESLTSRQLRRAQDLDSPWPVTSHAYRDNMTLVARIVDSKGQEVTAGVYTVGAFVDDECRGIGRWIDDRLYLLAHGNDGLRDEVTFKALNNATGETVDLTDKMEFANVAHGGVSNPIVLHLPEASGIDDVYGNNRNYIVYPVPVIDRLYVNGDVESIQRVKVLDINGKVVVDEQYEDGVDVYRLDAGTYVACLVTNQGLVYRKFLKLTR